MEDNKDKRDDANHADLTENIDEVVDDLFRELAGEIELDDEADLSSIEDAGWKDDISDESFLDIDEIADELEKAAAEPDGQAGGDEQPAESDPAAPAAAPAPPDGSLAEEPVPDAGEAFGERREFIYESNQVPEEFATVVHGNLALLGNCVARLAMIEKLFKETPGYGKLYEAGKNLRELLEYQRDSLARALDGDYSRTEPPPTLPVRRWKVVRKPKAPSLSMIPCPWQTINIAKWRGTPVGFLSEQVAHVSSEPVIKTAKFSGQDFFPLKNLKKHPWSKLAGLFAGNLTNVPEDELNKLEFPILKHPGVLQAFSEPLPKCYLLILYNENAGGGAVFLDSQLEEVTITPRWRWKPETANTVLAGHLVADGAHLPVIQLASEDEEPPILSDIE